MLTTSSLGPKMRKSCKDLGCRADEPAIRPVIVTP